MLIRDTKNYGETKVFVEKEIEFDSLNGMKTIIPYHSQWKKLLIQVSGGLDSALMLFLTAKAFRDMGATTQILPLSFEVPTKAKNLSSARKIIQTVRDLVGYDHLLPGDEIKIPMAESTLEGKNLFFMNTILNYFENAQIDFDFNGNTKNPPESVRKSFRDDTWRELSRDNRTSIYNAPSSASPNALNDKSGIVFLYKKFDLIDRLAPYSLSCDIELSEQKERGLPIPCGECWWCRERAWGFAANEIVDPSLTNT